MTTKKLNNGYKQAAGIRMIVEKRFRGDQQFYREMAKVFTQTTTENIKLIREFVSGKDAEKIRFTAHYIKGGASNLGVEDIRALAEKIENLEADKILQQTKTMVLQLEEYLTEFNNFLENDM